MTVCNAEWYAKKLKPIEGWRYIGIFEDTDDCEYYALIFADPNDSAQRALLWVLRDDEGNGPGSLNLQVIKPIGGTNA